MEPSPKKNQVYANASGGLMPNQGQMKPRLLLETGHLGNFCFQNVEPVKKPLLAVSDVNEKGNIGFFDGHNSSIICGTPAEMEALRKLVASIKTKVPLHYTNGTYKMKAWQPEAPFGRQGR